MGQRGIGAKPIKRKTDLEPAPIAADPPMTRAEAVATFLERLTITSGDLAGTKLKLRPWQAEAVRELYATDEQGHRSVRTAVASMGRKGGKTTFCAALCLVHLAGPEARSRGQVVSGAADRQQAGIIYSELRAFALADPELSDRINFRLHSKEAEDFITGSTFTTLSSDAKKAHGLSPSFAVCDEVAQWLRPDLLDALRTGQGAIAEPLLIAISTRSPDPDNPLEQLLSYAEDVRSGVIVDPAFASFVWSAPLDLDPFDEATWHTANPDMTETRLRDIRAQVMQVKRLPSLLPAFNAFVLNKPTAVDARFISPQDWDACSDGADASGPCFGGLDLAGGASDLAAVSLYWPETKLLRVWAFMPAGRIDAAETTDRAPYRQWAAAGHIVVTPGRAIDRAWLGNWIAEKTEGLELVSIAADRWMLADFQQQTDREGLSLPLEPHGQGFRDMSPSVGALERLVLDARLRHEGNPLLRWAIANSSVELDPAGNRKLSKLRSRGRIDPAVAAIMAIGTAERQPAVPSFEFTAMSL